MGQHMDNQKVVAGVILAGGLARRMGNQDKGLVLYKGRPLVSYPINALSGVTELILINANRNLAVYKAFGLPVIVDKSTDFAGPLAGILSAMLYTTAEILVVVPCDSPLIKAEHLHKLLKMRAKTNADVAVAFDGERLHPVFLAIKTPLGSSRRIKLPTLKVSATVEVTGKVIGIDQGKPLARRIFKTTDS